MTHCWFLFLNSINWGLELIKREKWRKLLRVNIFSLRFLDVMMSILLIHAAVVSFCQFVTNTIGKMMYHLRNLQYCNTIPVAVVPPTAHISYCSHWPHPPKIPPSNLKYFLLPNVSRQFLSPARTQAIHSRKPGRPSADLLSSLPADPSPSLVPGATTEYQLQNSLHPPTSSQHLLLHFIPQLQQILSPNLKADVFRTTSRLSNFSWDPNPPGSSPDL